MKVFNDAGTLRGNNLSISTYEFIGDSVRYKTPGSNTWITINP